MTNEQTPLAFQIVRSSRCSGRGGFASVRSVYELHARYSANSALVPLTRKDGNPREFSTRQRARAAIRKIRA